MKSKSFFKPEHLAAFQLSACICFVRLILPCYHTFRFCVVSKHQPALHAVISILTSCRSESADVLLNEAVMGVSVGTQSLYNI